MDTTLTPTAPVMDQPGSQVPGRRHHHKCLDERVLRRVLLRGAAYQLSAVPLF